MRVAPMNSRFLDACRRRPTDVRPVWFMRQAGRYMKQYRDIRAKHGILEICKRPDLAAQITLQPVEILDVDAAIIFADLLLPVEPMGLKLRFAAGEGPVIDNPVRTSSDIDSLSISNTDELGYVGETIQMVVRALAGRVPVIGFVGAPFTMASYMIEGGPSRTFLRTKQMMYRSAVQGNLDPAVLLAPLPELRMRIHELLKRTGTRPGHIFNLGHGILPETPVENVKACVEIVRDFKP